MGSEKRNPSGHPSGGEVHPSGGDERVDISEERVVCRDAPTYPPGSLVGSYWVEDLIGEGGTSCVYRARHAKIGRRVALKALQAEFAGNREVVERFFDEARAANAVDHENIVQVTDLVEDPSSGTHYFVMELLEGFDLRELVDLEGALRPERAVRIAVQIADALVAAHAVGVVHRDLKPENIYLVEGGRREDFVKVLDFGVAKLADDIARVARNFSKSDIRTAPGALVGTPAYMSPEQLSGHLVDHRTDIYSFGMLLYEVLTGWPPFKATSFADFVVAHVTEVPQPLRAVMHSPEGLPEDLEALVLACLAKDPDKRPQTMAEVLEALVAIASREGWRLESTVTPAPVVAAIREIEERGQKEPTLRLHRQDLIEATRPSSADWAVATIGEHLEEATSLFEELGLGSGRPDDSEIRKRAAPEPGRPSSIELEVGDVELPSRPSSVELELGDVEPLDADELAAPRPVPPAPPPPRAAPALEPTPATEREAVVPASGDEPALVRPRRWVVPVVLAAAVVVLGGGAAAYGLLDREPAPPATPPPAAEAERVTISFRSEPEGAEVYRQGEERPLGRTPFDASVEPGEGSATFELRRDGYRPARRTLPLAASSEVRVVLERLPPADVAEAPPAEGEEGPGDGASEGEPDRPGPRGAKRPPRGRPRPDPTASAPEPPRPAKGRGPDRDGLMDPYGS